LLPRTWTRSILSCLLLATLLAALTPAHGAQATVPSAAHVTIHHWPPGLPTILDSDHYDIYVAGGSGWTCTPAQGTIISGSQPVVTVTCDPSATKTLCTSVQAGGYHVHLDVGGLQTQLADGSLTVTAACTDLSVSKELTFPTNDPGTSSVVRGAGSPSFTCTSDASRVVPSRILADFWVFCDVTAEASVDPTCSSGPACAVPDRP